MFPHDADRFIHTLLDGDGRYHNHKLAESIAFVQLVDGAQIDVGLACAGLHFHGEMPTIRLHFAGHLDAVALLNGLQVAQQFIAGELGAVFVYAQFQPQLLLAFFQGHG